MKPEWENTAEGDIYYRSGESTQEDFASNSTDFL
jgi:hypothetical protein